MHIMIKLCKLIRKNYTPMIVFTAYSEQVKIKNTKVYMEFHV